MISEMIKDLGRYTSSEPPLESSEDCYERGDACLDMIKFLEAEDILTHALLDRWLGLSLILWVAFHIHLRRIFDQAIVDFGEAIRLSCTKSDVKKKLAQAYFLRGSFKCAFAKTYVFGYTSGIVNSIKDRLASRGKTSFDIIFDNGAEDLSRALQYDPVNFDLRMKVDKVKNMRDRSWKFVGPGGLVRVNGRHIRKICDELGVFLFWNGEIQ